jgi:hypothetical protein
MEMRKTLKGTDALKFTKQFPPVERMVRLVTKFKTGENRFTLIPRKPPPVEGITLSGSRFLMTRNKNFSCSFQSFVTFVSSV